MAVNLGAAYVMTWWFLRNPAVESTLLTPEEVDQLVNSDFAGYYSEHAATSFAASVWTNNALVAALCIAFGVLGFPVLSVLYSNILNLAIIASIMIRHGRADVFFGLILPHGMLELTAVFVAAGVGLRVFWAWIEPGNRSRPQAVAVAFRSSVVVALGLVVVLLVSGAIEAFVTPSPLPTWARVGVGALAEVVFFAYVFVVGRRAALAGVTGDRVDLVAGDRRVRARVSGVDRTRLLAELVTAMAPLEPTLVEADWTRLAAGVAQVTRRRALVVLLTTVEPVVVEETLLPTLAALTRHHRVVIASVADPTVAAMAATRSSTREVYDAAAAERSQASKDRVVEALGRLGVTVVDAPPEQLPPALADHYLMLKSRGLL